ncbi:MAG: hypothetical protein WKF67_13745 [Rubrobacteraceae bacterium]
MVRIDNATERLPPPLALRRFGKQIVILGEQHSFQLRRTVQQRRISKLARSVFVGREHVHPA